MSFRNPTLTAAAFAALILGAPGASAQQTLLDESGTYQIDGASMWDSGDAFRWDYNQFFGVDSDPGHVVIGAGTSDQVSVGTPIGTYRINPYFQFDTDFRLGIEVGASLDSGSVDGNIDVGVSLEAPDQIRVGEAFSLTGSASQLGSSGFVTRAPTAQAYLDGILEAYVGAYSRIEYIRPGVLSDRDFRLGNRGFTDGATNNVPYATLADIDVRAELISVNRDQSGVIRYLGTGSPLDGDAFYDELGAGSSVSTGPLEFTAGNIDVVANGSLVGNQVVGSGSDTLASAVLDIDHLLTGGPQLGFSLEHDWQVIDYALGYDIVDLDAGLDILLEQDFTLESEILLELVFDSEVLLDGVLTDRYLGAIDEIPLLTLLENEVGVEARILVEAMLTNDTRLGFLGSLDTTLLHAFASFGWDISGRRGSRSVEVGPVYENSLPVDLGDISVYDNTFSLGREEIGRWQFALVPEPGTALLLAVGCLGLGRFGRRRPQHG